MGIETFLHIVLKCQSIALVSAKEKHTPNLESEIRRKNGAFTVTVGCPHLHNADAIMI